MDSWPRKRTRIGSAEAFTKRNEKISKVNEKHRMIIKGIGVSERGEETKDDYFTMKSLPTIG